MHLRNAACIVGKEMLRLSSLAVVNINIIVTKLKFTLLKLVYTVFYLCYTP